MSVAQLLERLLGKAVPSVPHKNTCREPLQPLQGAAVPYVPYVPSTSCTPLYEDKSSQHEESELTANLTNQQHLLAGTEPSVADGNTQPDQPRASQAQHATNTDGEINVELFLDQAALDNGVSVAWIREVVIDEFDATCISQGQLSFICLSAHIKYHSDLQQSRLEQEAKIRCPQATTARNKNT